jgi:hypothetical protein
MELRWFKHQCNMRLVKITLMNLRMPSYFLFITLCVCHLHISAQVRTDSTKALPEFKNQGEQEVYWTKQFFQNQYKEQTFKVFSGTIINKNNTFIFSEDSLTVYDYTIELKTLFLKGLLYPALIGGSKIGNIEELKFVEETPQKRRFRFLIFIKGLSNPVVCFFELTNVRAKRETNLIEFIRRARLSFFKQSWVMI